MIYRAIWDRLVEFIASTCSRCTHFALKTIYYLEAMSNYLNKGPAGRCLGIPIKLIYIPSISILIANRYIQKLLIYIIIIIYRTYSSLRDGNRTCQSLRFLLPLFLNTLSCSLCIFPCPSLSFFPLSLSKTHSLLFVTHYVVAVLRDQQESLTASPSLLSNTLVSYPIQSLYLVRLLSILRIQNLVYRDPGGGV